MPRISKLTRRWLLLLATVGWACLVARSAEAQSYPGATDRFFVASDGVRLHYLEAGPSAASTLVLIPGWTMPAWIWGPQITAFSRHYHVVAFDPRGQGLSEVALTGYEPRRRGQDIADLLSVIRGRKVVLVGWSLGVLDTLAFIHAEGDGRIAGLVLVDNSVGEEPPPAPSRAIRPPAPPIEHADFMRQFVRSMFRKPQSPDYLNALTDATLRTPQYACTALLAYPVPRSYWRNAVYSTTRPLLYAVRPAFAAQAANLERHRPNTEIALFTGVGHALFVDDARRFNQIVGDFIARVSG
ncbi:MAG: alpha/beta hydrolase [Acetobacteraceae bacterium]|nr:alpha/beta hydrolase [Acetobacteraceae bacterium]